MRVNKQSDKILVIHGPNMNLLGIRTKGKGRHLTLDKLNRHLRKSASKYEIELKIIQCNDEGRAVSTIQRMRKKIKGILLFPGPWQYSGHVLKDTLNILSNPLVTVSTGESVDIIRGKKNYTDKNICSAGEKAIEALNKVILKHIH